MPTWMTSAMHEVR